MIKIAGLWELGWNTPIKEVEQWEFPLRDYGVDEFIMSPVSGISNNAVKEVPDSLMKMRQLRYQNLIIQLTMLYMFLEKRL